MTYTNLLPSLIAQNLIEKRDAPLVSAKLPIWYKPNECCAFHSDALGHDTENCFVFKWVQGLVRLGMIKLDDMPNVETNPFLEHGAVNMIIEDENLIMDILKMKTPLVHVHLKLFNTCILKQNHDKCSVCLRDSKGCFDMQKYIQMLISNGVLQVGGKKKNDEVSVIVPIFNKPKAFEIFFPPRESTPPANSAKRLDIKMPTQFPYKSDKAAPWRYEPTIIVNGVEKRLVNNKAVTNIPNASSLTRNGRFFTPANLRGGKHVVEKSDNGKDPLVIPESRPIQDVDAEDFFRLIRKSDYKVVDQLLQTQSKIYVMSFLLNSEARHKALLKVLGQAYVNPYVTVDQFDHVVGNITSCNTLSFSDNEFPSEGKKHNNTLYISMGYEKDSLSNVWVDTDSSLNEMPTITLAKLSYIGIDISQAMLLWRPLMVLGAL